VPTSAQRRVLRVVVLAVLYVAASRVATSAALLHGSFIAIWAPAGLALAALLRYGRGVWPGVLIGAFVGDLLGPAEAPGAVVMAIGSTLEVALCAGVLRRVVPGTRMDRVPDVLALLVSGAAGSALGGVCGATVQTLEADLAGRSWMDAFAAWALGDLVGIVLVAPLLLALVDRRCRPLLRRPLEGALTIAVLIAVCEVIFNSSRAVLWLTVPVLILVPLRQGILGTIAAGAVLALSAFAHTAAGLGPFAADGTPDLVEAQLFTVTMVGALLLLAAVMEERRRALLGHRAMAQEDAALRRVATAVARAPSLEEVSALAGQEAAALFEADAGIVVRFEATAAQVLGQHSRVGDDTAATGTLIEIEPGSAVAQVRDLGRPGRFDERGRKLSMPPYTQRVAAPVFADGRLWGALIVCTSRDDDLADDAELRLGRFAELVGLAMANADARTQLLAQATSDPLTGLVNHRTFHERLHEEVALAHRHRRALSVAVFDVDRFKHVNDTLGHVVGDAVIVEVARRVRAVAREGEIVARIGGDEFALLLPGTAAANALQAADRLRRSVGAARFNGVGHLTLSGGVCDLSQAADGEELLRLADGALYWAKLRGRDACLRYSPDVVEELSATERAERLERSQAMAAVRALARAIDAKDPATTRHSERVAELTARLAEEAGWPAARVTRLRDAALVHDVGKIGVPDAILSKPGGLTDAEYEVIKRHADLGARIAAEVLDDEQTAWVRGHHERYDGRGYPDELAGAAISDGARLLALADAWDAMTGARVYSAPMASAEALAECREQCGRQFAPEAVDALERLASAGMLHVEATPAAA
jgi:diguanylate cyclase (GGDEF)-like protein